MSEWQSVRLEDIAADEKSAISKPYGSSMVKDDYRLSGIPVVRGVNLTRGIFHDDDFVFISPELADKIPGAQLGPGDLVVTHRGTVGQVSMIPRRPKYQRYVTSTSQVKVRLDPARAVPEFFYYWFCSTLGRRTILEHVSTVGVPGLVQPVATVKRLKVPCPPLETQRVIAGVLSTLDDKIAANTKLAAAADELLATRLQSLVGPDTPHVRLSDIANVNGSTVKPSPGSHLKYVDIAAVGVGFYEFPSATPWIDAPSRARRAIRKGDTLWSTVRPNRRSHALNLSDDPLLVGSTGLAVLSPSTVGWAYLYEVTRRPEFTAYLETVAEGSAYPAVRADRFGEALVPLTDDASRRSFEQLADPLRDELHSLDAENRALAATRDALLPQLMSGKLRVRDAEKVLENAGV